MGECAGFGWDELQGGGTGAGGRGPPLEVMLLRVGAGFFEVNHGRRRFGSMGYEWLGVSNSKFGPKMY